MGQHGEQRHLVIARLLAGAVALAAPVASAAECKLALVLGLDVSSSVDEQEYAIQADGLAQALRDKDVIEAILSGPGDGIMASVFEWSGYWHQAIIADWTWLGDEAAIRNLADRVSEHPRDIESWPTALGRAVAFAADMQRRVPANCDRQIIDISGDGVNNRGAGPDSYRRGGHFDGLIINGLVIRGDIPDPLPHYEKYVIHGPGAFVEVAENYDDYPEAIRRKLLRELLPTAIALSDP